MNYYKPIFFKPYEFVDKATYNKFGDNSLFLMDYRILITMDKIRSYFNKPITINNWKTGGNREWSGLRIPSSPYYSIYSQHSHGRAIDFIVKDIDASKVREAIKNNLHIEAFEYITAIEDFKDMSWVHVDCRNYDKFNKGLLIFSN